MATEMNGTNRQRVEKIIEKFVAFLDNHQWVVRVNTVSFFTEKMWECVVVRHFGDVAREIVQLTETEMARLPAGQLPPPKDGERELCAIHEFINECVDHRLENSGVLCEVDSVLSQLTQTVGKKDHEQRDDSQNQERSSSSSVVQPKALMNIKKSHEVEEMSRFTAKLAGIHELQKVVDIGSGKGYLGQYLSLQHGLDVIGIDSSDTNTHGARDRSHKLQKKWAGISQHSMKIQQSSSKFENPKEAFREIYTKRTHKLKNMQRFLNCPDNTCEPSVEKDSSGSQGLKNMPGQSESTSEGLTSQMVNVLPISQSECSSSDVNQGLLNMHQPDSQSPGILTSTEMTDSNDGSGLSEDLQQIDLYSNDDQDSLPEQKSPVYTYSQTNHNTHKKEKKRTTPEAVESTAAFSTSSHGKNNTTKNGSRFCSVTAFVEPSTSLASVVSRNSEEAEQENEVPFMLIGLHTCGDLAPSTLRLFVHNDTARVLLNVGCCYQKLSEEFETGGWHVPETKPEACGFPMSHFLRSKGIKVTRPARMLASMAADRIATSQVVPAMGLFYRSVLQVLLRDHYRLPTMSENVGKLAPKCRSFLEYARKALKKLQFDDSKLSDVEISAYAERYQPYFCQLQALNQLRVALSPTIEGLFMLDRLCYLQEQKSVRSAALVRLFDPVTSPRCYAILATR
ncbi:methyltransferase-like protein 25 isoform X2 [Patiria miniata]|uniref:Methyltransferase domain-containing protein n=1 Tax=Patiria miniata TaxID=46514 RepID=A0A914BBK3_PATMI|nr:methyltransferase-like protein 25 isoform X2 [Patiria miniata]